MITTSAILGISCPWILGITDTQAASPPLLAFTSANVDKVIFNFSFLNLFLQFRIYCKFIFTINPKKHKQAKNSDLSAFGCTLIERSSFICACGGSKWHKNYRLLRVQLTFLNPNTIFCSIPPPRHPATFKIFILTLPCQSCSSRCNVLDAWFPVSRRQFQAIPHTACQNKQSPLPPKSFYPASRH